MIKTAYEMAMGISDERQRRLDKFAEITGGSPSSISDGLKMVGGVAAGLFTGGALLKKLIEKINNDSRRKSIIENIVLNDPALKDIDKKTLLEWYAAMYRYAPTLSLDKATVKEVLHNFAMFGKVDIQTLHTLADTEQKVYNRSTGDINVYKSLLH